MLICSTPKFYTSSTAQLIFYSGVAWPQLKLARDVKGSTKGFCKYISGKKERKRKQKESLLLNVAMDLVMKDMKKTKVPSTNDLLEQVQQKTIKMIRGCKYAMHKERLRAECAQP